MRFIIDRENRPTDAIWALLTRDEGSRLRDALDEFLTGEANDFDWHVHIESSDGRDKELTLSFYAEDGSSTTDPRWSGWYRDDVVTAGMFGSAPSSTTAESTDAVTPDEHSLTSASARGGSALDQGSGPP